MNYRMRERKKLWNSCYFDKKSFSGIWRDMWGFVEIWWENMPILQGFQAFGRDGEIRTNERLNNKTNGKKLINWSIYKKK